jgi:Histone acetylation protein/Bromodomain
MDIAPQAAVSFDEGRSKRLSGETAINTIPTSHTDATNSNYRHHLSRLVSQDDSSNNTFEKQSAVPLSDNIPPFPDPLQNPRLLRNHVAAVRLEADLYPLRLILSRLMFHPTHNRKGIFNHPVDPVALGLPDYDRIIKRPMDLGTVKRRLHAIAYRSREEAEQDIRLVFTNAMLYNPPLNLVHISARELLSYFDSCCQGLDPPVSDAPALSAPMPENQPHLQDVANVSSTSQEHKSSPLAPVSSERTVSDAVSLEADGSTSHVAPPVQSRQQASANVSTRNTAQKSDTSTDLSTEMSAQSKPRIRVPKRRASFTTQGSSHACHQCEGRTCLICRQGCLQHEPALLVCCGAQCAGSRIRKSAVYFTTRDGSNQICDRCFVGLPSTVPPHMQSDTCRYKQDLLKRKNDEEIAEEWITCRECNGGVHVICAMHNGYVSDRSLYRCPSCRLSLDKVDTDTATVGVEGASGNQMFTYVSGSDAPVPLATFRDAEDQVLDASSLKVCSVSRFIEEKIRDVMSCSANSGKTITARVISDCDRSFSVPKPVRRYFRMVDGSSPDTVVPPALVQYRQKAIVVFQKIDGLEVCVFCMYVQEYDGDTAEEKRVYIAYIDSVEHFRPRELRTQVFQEILVAYLATARERGYTRAHIWACPPSRGNCFVFWNHPVSQRVPTSERLQAWYHSALSRGIDAGVIVDVKSLYETDFELQLAELSQDEVSFSRNRDAPAPANERMLCPPLIDGDFWIEEALRVHQAAIDRNLKVRSPGEVCVWNVGSRSRTNYSLCPALQVAALLKDRIMTHPSSVPFRRPVNAAALKLKDYHKIVKNPVDLGTIYSRCVLGEYHRLRDVANDVILMVANAKKFNPPGHIVNSMATEVLNLFNSELNALTLGWGGSGKEKSWQSHDSMSMSLNMVLESDASEASPDDMAEQSVVIIEDDRSSDGSKSMSSSVATEASNVVLEKRTPDAVADKTHPLGCRRNSTVKSLKLLDLHSDGADAVMQKMVGNDVWLLNKRTSAPLKSLKTNTNKRRRHSFDAGPDLDEPAPKKRRQTWLCEEVGRSIRRLRTSFFSCCLAPKENSTEVEEQKIGAYEAYVTTFNPMVSDQAAVKSSLADTRSALLELSQFRNFEFDTLRRAKYSTSMLLYHIHHPDAPGAVPSCTSCGERIKEVRWHKAKPIFEVKTSLAQQQPKVAVCTASNPSSNTREDLCVACYEPRQSEEEFVPIPVSLKSWTPPT